MFEGIQRNLDEAFKRLRGLGRLTEANVREGMQEVRKALLDADVNYTVADEFVNRVTKRSLGQEVLRTVNPREQIIRIIYDELVALMGPVHARKVVVDTVILDTAGRLHIDEMPMDELRQIDRTAKPRQVYLVCDAMTGQDAVNSAKAFNDALELDGVILTKMDGDARGGAALSIKEVTKVPIKFIGVGEKLDRLEMFRPEGMAQRILGQGDILSIVEKVARAQKDISQEELQKQQEKLAKGDFSLDDFRKQFEMLAKMGSMSDMIKALPGGFSQMIPEGEDPEAAVKRIRGMIDSMTKEERRNPDVIDINRRRRIASGSGTEPHEVKQFLGQFEQVRVLMRQMANMSILDRIKMMTGLGKAGAFMPGGMLPKQKIGTGHRKSPKERAKERKKKKKR
jgi:signal recognition particle subunit SRP54